MKTLAVIIPIYNVEQYLLECLESLSKQSYSDMLFICVDDGSTDSSPTILADYAKNDPRFHIITKENQGLGAARNTGLEYIYTTRCDIAYVGFVDSDDVLSQDYYRNLIYTLEAHNAPMVTTRDLVRFYDEKYSKDLFTISQPQTKGIVRKVTSKNLASKIEVWRSVFRREVLEQLRFPPIRFAEDEPFSVCAHALSGRVALSSNARYFYRMRAGSLTTKLHAPQEFFHAFEFVYKFFLEHNFLHTYKLPTYLLRPNDFCLVDSHYLTHLRDFLASLEIPSEVIARNPLLRIAENARDFDEFMYKTQSFKQWRKNTFSIHFTKNRKRIVLFGKVLLDRDAQKRVAKPQ